MSFIRGFTVVKVKTSASPSGVWSQTDPWPSLVTLCDIMPLVAQDINTKPDLLSCATTAWPACEIINCQTTSSNDQIELELLQPCRQHPAVSVKISDIKGNLFYQDTFNSSGLTSANIRGTRVILNVTVVQKVIALGFAVSSKLQYNETSEYCTHFVLCGEVVLLQRLFFIFWFVLY